MYDFLKMISHIFLGLCTLITKPLSSLIVILDVALVITLKHLLYGIIPEEVFSSEYAIYLQFILTHSFRILMILSIIAMIRLIGDKRASLPEERMDIVLKKYTEELYPSPILIDVHEAKLGFIKYSFITKIPKEYWEEGKKDTCATMRVWLAGDKYVEKEPLLLKPWGYYILILCTKKNKAQPEVLLDDDASINI